MKKTTQSGKKVNPITWANSEANAAFADKPKKKKGSTTNGRKRSK